MMHKLISKVITKKNKSTFLYIAYLSKRATGGGSRVIFPCGKSGRAICVLILKQQSWYQRVHAKVLIRHLKIRTCKNLVGCNARQHPQHISFIYTLLFHFKDNNRPRSEDTERHNLDTSTSEKSKITGNAQRETNSRF